MSLEQHQRDVPALGIRALNVAKDDGPLKLSSFVPQPMNAQAKPPVSKLLGYLSTEYTGTTPLKTSFFLVATHPYETVSYVDTARAQPIRCHSGVQDLT